MSKLRHSLLTPQEKIEEYDVMTIEQLDAENNRLKEKLFSMGPSYANTAHIGNAEWFVQKNKIRHEREVVCRIRWSKMKRKDPSLRKYAERANEALDRFFEGSPRINRVKPSSAIE